MSTFIIAEHSITLIQDHGDRPSIDSDSPHFESAELYALHGNEQAFLVLHTKDNIDEHDLANWNGSPIYYLTKEQAQEQVDASRGFWKYHDFGIEARCGRRYATVPIGFGPTAPEGYEWACVSIED